MSAPADVCRELMSLGAREEHAKTQGMCELVLIEPTTLLDDLAVHDRYLAGWPAEARCANAGPQPYVTLRIAPK